MDRLFRLPIVAILSAALAFAASCASMRPDSTERIQYTFDIVEVLEGEYPDDSITATNHHYSKGVRIITVDEHEAPPSPTGPSAIRMALAFQLAPGKSHADFLQFKELDLPWVAKNNGSNRATIWTERSDEWPFDAFEDVTFASRADFKRAYAGNPELNKAAEGLFGDKVLVAIVQER